jgi:hypothetical protein
MTRRCGHCGALFEPTASHATHPGPSVVERHGAPLCDPCADEYERIYRRRERETESMLFEFANARRGE